MLQKRIEAYQSGEIKFNLLALIGNRAAHFEKQIEHVEANAALDAKSKEQQINSLRAQIEDEKQKVF